MSHDNNYAPHKLVICGVGSIGRKYLKILKETWPDIKIGVLRSGIGPFFNELNYADHFFTSIEEVLNWKPNAGIIASPASKHLEQAITFSNAKIPVLLEKPVGTGKECSKDWNKLLNLSKQNTLLIGYVLRHDPNAEHLYKIINQNKLGKLVEANFNSCSWLPAWRSDVDYRNTVSSKKELGGGVLLEVSHEIDMALWLFGEISLIEASIKNTGLLDLDKNVEDFALLIGRNNEEVNISILLNFSSKENLRTLKIKGEKGELNWNLLKDELIINLKENKPLIYKTHIKREELYKYQLEHFFSCIKGGSIPICSLKEGINVLDLISKARKIANPIK